MKRVLLVITVLLCVVLPAAASARVIERYNGDRPSSRSIRRAARAVTVRNPQMLSVRELSLDRTYESTVYGVKMQSPSSWEQLELEQRNAPLTLVVMFLSPNEQPTGIRQNVNLVIEDLPAEMTLAEYSDLGIRMERDFFQSYSLQRSDDILLAGAYRAHRVVFTASLENLDMTFEQIWLIRDRQAYVWTFADSAGAFDDHVETFERMMDTLTVQ